MADMEGDILQRAASDANIPFSLRGPPQIEGSSTSPAATSIALTSGDTVTQIASSTVYESTTESTGLGYGSSTTSQTLATATMTSSRLSSTETPSTFFTSTYSSDPIVQPASTSQPPPSAQPTATTIHHGLSKGSLAAVIVVPVLAVLALSFLALFLLLRRKSGEPNHRNRAGSGGSTASILPASLREKWAGVGPFPSTRSSRDGTSSSSSSSRRDTPPATAAHAPAVTNDRINAYYTGLDTSSHATSSGGLQGRRSEGGSTSFADPPPAYAGPRLVVAEHDPVSPVSPLEEEMVQRPASPTIPSHLFPPPFSYADDDGGAGAGDARSINSDSYSDTASVHSARAARRSMGLAHVIHPSVSSAALSMMVGSRRVSEEE